MSNIKVTPEEVKENMKDIIVRTLMDFDKPCTYVTVRMKNGFTLRESTTCVDPDNYDEEIGKQICLRKIEDKIWFLLGYSLQDRESKKANSTFQSRMIEEYNELGDRLGKLNTVLNSSGFKEKVGETQYNLMCKQGRAITDYWNVLGERIKDLGIEV